MSKVVSFKTSNGIYDQLKSLNKSFRELIEPLVVDMLKQSLDVENKRNPRQYTHSIPTKEVKSYDIVVEEVDVILKRLNANGAEV